MPFEPPKITDKKNAIWIEIAKPGFRDPRYLWSDYWRRFNTITIPLLDEDAYFADALTAAKEAQSRQHLEELLAKRFEARRKELEQTVRDIFYASFSPRTPFPSEAARTAASKVGTTGSLDSFIQSVCGVVWGWGERSNEHEALQIHPADGHDSGDSGGSTEGDGERQHSDFSFSGNDVGSETQQWPEYPKFVHDDEADLLWNGIPSAWRVLECEDAEETPLERQLPSPTLPKDNAVLAVKGVVNRGDDEHISRQQSPTSRRLSSETDCATRAMLPLGTSKPSQLTENSSAYAPSTQTPGKAPASAIPSPSSASPRRKQGTSPDLTGGEGRDRPQWPSPRSNISSQEGGDTTDVDARRNGSGGSLEGTRKRSLNEGIECDGGDYRFKQRKREAESDDGNAAAS